MAKFEKYEAGDSAGKNRTDLQNQSPLLYSQELSIVGSRDCVELFVVFFFPREKVMVYGKASSPDWTVPNLFLLACEDCLVQASSQSPGCDLS